jgi:hypothetical protein
MWCETSVEPTSVISCEKSGPDYFVKPTVIVDVDQTHRIVQEEIFGPVLVPSAVPWNTRLPAVLRVPPFQQCLNYKWNSNLATGYSYGHLDNFYSQHLVNLTYVLPVTTGQSLKTGLRFAHSTDDGGSNVDNNVIGAMFTYNLGGHALGLGYQGMSGDTSYAYVNGTDASW